MTRSPAARRLGPWIVAQLRRDARALLAVHGTLPYGWVSDRAREMGVHRVTAWRALAGGFPSCAEAPVQVLEHRRAAIARSAERS